MQIAKTWDRTSLKKIGKGLLISLGGALLAGFVIFGLEVNDFILNSDPINWRAVVFACWGAFATSIINAGKEYFSGADRQMLEGHEEAVDQKVLDIVSDVKEEAKDQVIEDIKNNS